MKSKIMSHSDWKMKPKVKFTGEVIACPCCEGKSVIDYIYNPTLGKTQVSIQCRNKRCGLMVSRYTKPEFSLLQAEKQCIEVWNKRPVIQAWELQDHIHKI